MTVLGGLQGDAQGHLANWMVPGKLVPGMGGAMDLVAGARSVIVAMARAAEGGPKIMAECALPPAAARRISLIVTELAVIEPADAGLVLRERGPGLSVEMMQSATGAPLLPGGDGPEIELGT